MLNKQGFFQNPLTKGGTIGSATDFVRRLDITPTITNGDKRLTYTIDSNIPSINVTVALIGVASNNFSEGNSVVLSLDGSGNATTNFNIIDGANLNDANATFFANVTHTGVVTTLLGTSSNTSLLGANTITATGGNITTTGNFVEHAFTSNNNFVLTSKTRNTTLYRLLVGGGGAGGMGLSNCNFVGSGLNQWSSRPGAGGGAGQLLMSNVNTSTVSTGTYPLVVGAGGSGTYSARSGNVTTGFGLSAGAGGPGQSYTGTVSADGFYNGGGGQANLDQFTALVTLGSTTPAASLFSMATDTGNFFIRYPDLATVQTLGSADLPFATMLRDIPGNALSNSIAPTATNNRGGNASTTWGVAYGGAGVTHEAGLNTGAGSGAGDGGAGLVQTLAKVGQPLFGPVTSSYTDAASGGPGAIGWATTPTTQFGYAGGGGAGNLRRSGIAYNGGQVTIGGSAVNCGGSGGDSNFQSQFNGFDGVTPGSGGGGGSGFHNNTVNGPRISNGGNGANGIVRIVYALRDRFFTAG